MVRIKERYLLVNILYPPSPSKSTNVNVPGFVVLHQPTPGGLLPRDLIKGIRNQVAALFGDYGSGAFEGNNLVVKYLSKATSTFILKVKRAHYRLIWAALTTMDQLPLGSGGGRSCTFSVVRVSGTIRKVEEEAVRQARRLVLAAKAAESSGVRLPSVMALAGASRSTQNVQDDIAMLGDDEDNLEGA
ncbi:hypothetical protein ACHAQA_008717 [Verticillium albo-atrum]